MSRCKSCGAELMWIRMKTGKLMPVNPQPTYLVDGHGSEIIVTEDGLIASGSICPVPISPGHRKGWISHFATCPGADRHRTRHRQTEMKL